MKIDILYANMSCLDFGYWFKYIRIMIIYTTEHEVPYEIKSYTTQWFNLDSAFIPSCITKAWCYRTTTIKSRTSKKMRKKIKRAQISYIFSTNKTRYWKNYWMNQTYMVKKKFWQHGFWWVSSFLLSPTSSSSWPMIANMAMGLSPGLNWGDWIEADLLSG